MQKIIDQEDYLPAIINWIEELEQLGDKQTAQKAKEVVAKLNQGQLYLGFCGHFSAGKSTFINRMLGQEILPTSPVPTSANVVSISSGEDQALIHLRDRETLKLSLGELENLRQYCKDGEEVEKVEISCRSEYLAPSVVLLDTPGVDSTDPKHQQATAAALHLADIIFFITDYNHVQSEHNYLFLKELQNQGKPILFIVNQIDKHQEDEISIASFREGVETGLQHWGLEIKGLFFTSLKQLDHPANQWQLLMEIYDWINRDAKQLNHYQAQRTLQHLLKEHQNFQQEELQTTHQELFKSIEQLEGRLAEQNKQHELESFLQWRQIKQSLLKELEQESLRLIEKAELISYQVTQKAKAYLESEAPQFKVGLLFTKKKTEEERLQRLLQLDEELAQQCQTQIEWHIKQRFQAKLKEVEALGFSAEELQKLLADWKLETNPEQIKGLVKQGAIENSQYVYQFTKEVAQALKLACKRSLEGLLAESKRWLEKAEGFFNTLWQKDYSQLEELSSLYEQRQQLEQANEARTAELQAKLEQIYQHQPFLQVAFWSKLKELRLNLADKYNQQQPNKEADKPVTALDKSNQQVQIKPQLKKSTELGETENKLKVMIELIESYPIMKQQREGLQHILRKCEEQRYTMAIFGAFSAGKSSFINALLGKRLMPVSPHPTTAAIIKVMDGGEELDGKAKITFKGREQLERELQIACQRVAVDFNGIENLQGIRKQLERVQPKGLRSSVRPYYTYLRAMLDGWELEQENFGQELVVEEKTYQEYAAVESKACFVEQIECYHRTAWTEAGLQIIDTPGADSIFARHTNVTFQFMKEADIVVYLTYYNHAFSHADQDILEQLEKVKEKSQLDHMYFIINAADLAQDEYELRNVKEHVYNQLKRTGINTDKLYAVSSIKGLQGQDASFAELTQDLAHFIQENLEQLVAAEASKEMEAIEQQLQQLFQTAQQDQASRMKRLEEIEAAQDTVYKMIEQLQLESSQARLTQELSEQRFYIEQRLQLQFTKYFNESFNPAVLQGRSKDRLVESHQDFLHALEQRLNDEWKTTSLRLQGFLQGLAEEWVELIFSRMLHEQPILRGLLGDKSLLSQGNQKLAVNIPTLPRTLSESAQDDARWKELFKLYVNAKHFFEENGKQLFKDKLEQQLSPLISEYQEQVQELYRQEFNQAWSELKMLTQHNCSSVMSQQLEAEKALISGALTKEQLEELLENLKKVL